MATSLIFRIYGRNLLRRGHRKIFFSLFVLYEDVWPGVWTATSCLKSQHSIYKSTVTIPIGKQFLITKKAPSKTIHFFCLFSILFSLKNKNRIFCLQFLSDAHTNVILISFSEKSFTTANYIISNTSGQFGDDVWSTISSHLQKIFFWRHVKTKR